MDQRHPQHAEVMAAEVADQPSHFVILQRDKKVVESAATADESASNVSKQRHRLNRGGNRQLNYALHVMAIARCHSDPETKSYIARRQLEGKSKKEAIRCLKRHLSNVVYRQMEADLRRCDIAA